MPDLADTTLDELMRIARMWGYTLHTKMGRSGNVVVNLDWGGMEFDARLYQTMRAAVNDTLSIMIDHITKVIARIEFEKSAHDL